MQNNITLVAFVSNFCPWQDLALRAVGDLGLVARIWAVLHFTMDHKDYGKFTWAIIEGPKIDAKQCYANRYQGSMRMARVSKMCRGSVGKLTHSRHLSLLAIKNGSWSTGTKHIRFCLGLWIRDGGFWDHCRL